MAHERTLVADRQLPRGHVVRKAEAVEEGARMRDVRCIFGGVVAAPAFQKILSFALPYLKIPPQ